jgi:hypothetical protein
MLYNAEMENASVELRSLWQETAISVLMQAYYCGITPERLRNIVLLDPWAANRKRDFPNRAEISYRA